MKINFGALLIYSLITLWLAPAHAATITVSIQTDGFIPTVNECTLRNAVEAFNQYSDLGGVCPNETPAEPFGTNDKIILLPQTYTLSLPGDNDDNSSGDIDFRDFDGDSDESDVFVQGAGMEETIVTGAFPQGEEDRIFDILPGEDSGNVTLIDLTVSNGGASDGSTIGGGIRNHLEHLNLQRVHVRDNLGQEGGGIFNPLNGKILMLQSQVTGNLADLGGGIFNGGLLTIDESTIDNNDAIDGAGIYNNNQGFDQSLSVFNSTISRNRALPMPIGAGDVSGAGDPGRGGGLRVDVCDIVILTNTTISSNQANAQGGGIFADDSNCATGGPQVDGTFLFNSTVASNEVLSPSGQGGGIFFFFLQPPPIVFGSGFPGSFPGVNLQSTILADNQAATGPDCFNFIQSFGFNLIENLSPDCQMVEIRIAPNVIGEDPQLGGLQNNGGPTETHGLPETSPAIDAGNDDVDGCDAPELDEIVDNNDFTAVPLTRDQRGFPRPIAVRDPNDPICDIGAFEFQVFDFVVIKDDGLDGEAIPTGTTFDYTITVTNNGPGTASFVTLDDPLPSGMDFVSVTPSQGACAAIGQVIGCDLGDLAVGETATITVTVIATEDGTFTNVVTITLTNEFQEQLTETAQVTTVVTGGLFVFGSGIHCGLQPGDVQASPGFAGVLSLMVLTILGTTIALRRRAND